MKVWIDGAVRPLAEARVPVTDHGLLYGDGVFEGIRVYGARVFRLDDHLDRLAVGCRVLDLEPPVDRAALREIVLETARAYGEAEAYLRLLITRGEGELGVDPASCGDARIICIADRVRIYPDEKLATGIDLVTSSWRRPGADVLDPRVKSLNYLNSVLAKQEARRQGADEALLLNARGQVAEASVANVFVVEGEGLATPPVTDGALDGITRATVLELAAQRGLRSEERSLGRVDLLCADEVFLTGTGAGIVPVRSLDGRHIGNTARAADAGVTRGLREAFLASAPAAGVPFG